MATETMVRVAEDMRDSTMTGLRPQASESEPATSIEKARSPVVSDSARLLSAALIRNSSENTGSSGCTE